MKVYIIGGSKIDTAILKAELNLPANAELVCVESMEDVPLPERVQSVPLQVYEFKLTKPVSMPFIDTKKYRGHERPYKYHK